jgi:Ala-tRNA(Pro) deacylase
MSEPVFTRVTQLLTSRNITFGVLRHKPVYTSEDAAKIRGVPLSSGAKALVCKGEDRFVMFVIPADRKLASRKVRRLYGWRKLRFANREEVLTLTKLTPGSIPPFGSLFGLPTFCDERLSENKTINFNAGDHSISVSMRSVDYIDAEQPEVGGYVE